MKRLLIIVAIAAAAILAYVLFMWSTAVSGETEAREVERDPSRGAWFESLRVPGSGNSCCDVSDCGRTQARQRDDGSWMVVLDGVDGPEWHPVPPSAVIETPVSIDGDAYVCQIGPYSGGSFYGGVASPTPPSVRCFVPPVPGF